MKVVVVGGTGLIGSKLVGALGDLGHAVVAASPSSGVNTLTGEGLGEAIEGADVVVDVTNSPSFEADAVLAFFETSTSNLLEAELAAGVSHHLALSIVGIERLSEGGYFRGKIAQESLIADSPVPHTIVRATQFFEFLGGIAEMATEANSVHLPPVFFQPIAADEVVAFLARASLGSPANGVIEVAGPRPHRLDELVREYLTTRGDPRRVVTDQNARYSGARLGGRTLLPGDDASLGVIRFEDWLTQRAASS
jgi:uncharacterized protein YbjT (DUF2867 family)